MSLWDLKQLEESSPSLESESVGGKFRPLPTAAELTLLTLTAPNFTAHTSANWSVTNVTGAADGVALHPLSRYFMWHTYRQTRARKPSRNVTNTAGDVRRQTTAESAKKTHTHTVWSKRHPTQQTDILWGCAYTRTDCVLPPSGRRCPWCCWMLKTDNMGQKYYCENITAVKKDQIWDTLVIYTKTQCNHHLWPHLN